MKYLLSVFLFFTGIALYSQEYPVIQNISIYSDPLFKQQQKETESWYFNKARSLPPPPLSLYQYRTEEGDSLIQLAAVFNLPVDTLASLNGIQNIADFRPGDSLLIPSNPGIYINEESSSPWYRNLLSHFREQPYQSLKVIVKREKTSFQYYPGQYLPESYRTRFVQPLFLSPLRELTVTSSYGYRDHPFTGKWELHTGTDFRAPTGTEIRTCGDGMILSTGELEDYGKYIIIQHRNKYTSLYGHLSRILVNVGDKVAEGDVIALSGNTGMSTGPHLHFEIRKNGLPQNPENLLSVSGE